MDEFGGLDQEKALQGYVFGLRGEPEPVGQGAAFRRGWECGARDRQRDMKKPARGGLGIWRGSNSGAPPVLFIQCLQKRELGDASL